MCEVIVCVCVLWNNGDAISGRKWLVGVNRYMNTIVTQDQHQVSFISFFPARAGSYITVRCPRRLLLRLWRWSA